MHIVLFYDITSSRIRKKAADACADYGLDRTQFSAFVGNLTRSQQRELMQKLKNLVSDQPGALLLIPVNKKEWKQRLEFRQEAPGDGISTLASSIADREEHNGSLY
jgi:CRISPR-associated protein Cas2